MIRYKGIIGGNLARKGASPGDVLSLAICNEESEEGMYAQVKRLYLMFLLCYNFFPETIAMHPDHLALLKKQGKRLDVLIDEEASQQVADMLELSEIPRSIPLIADDTLDLFTCVARFTFVADEWKDYLIEALKLMDRD